MIKCELPDKQAKHYSALLRRSRRSLMSTEQTTAAATTLDSPQIVTKTSDTNGSSSKPAHRPSTPVRRAPLSLSDDEIGAIVDSDLNDDNEVSVVARAPSE